MLRTDTDDAIKFPRSNKSAPEKESRLSLRPPFLILQSRVDKKFADKKGTGGRIWSEW